MGRLIPAGTGMARYQNIGIQIDAPDGLVEGPDEDITPAPPPPIVEDLGPLELLAGVGGEGPVEPLEV
jgi:hypothetical protein